MLGGKVHVNAFPEVVGDCAATGGSRTSIYGGHMASAEREPITGSGGGAPAGSRGRTPGQGVRGAKPP